MLHVKKIISVSLILIFLLILSFTNSFAQDKLNVAYFYSPKCLNCKENTSFIDSLANNDKINLMKFNTDEDDCISYQTKYAEYYNVDDTKSLQIPAIYFGEYYYILSPSNQKEVLSKISEYIDEEKSFVNFEVDETSCQNENTFEKLAKKITLPGILIAGLIDGINPCAISMLLVFYSFLIFSNNKKKTSLIAIFFISGIFFANLLFGLGINIFYEIFTGNKLFVMALYLFAILICLTAIILNSIDILNYKKNGEIKNQLSDTVKFKMTNILRKTVFSKYAAFVALFIGFLIGMVELSCTGQIYLPTLVYMISNSSENISFIFMLIIYNIMFILPLLIIAICASFVKDVEILKKKILEKNSVIKIICNILFVFILILLIKDFLVIL